jgi:hypothetical protein
MEAVQSGWIKPVRNSRDAASVLAGKLKNVRYTLENWSKGISNLSLLISNCNTVILFLDFVEDSRPLYTHEWNFRIFIKAQLATLLRFKNAYWKKRYTVNRIKFGDECTKFFHAMATNSFRKNTISQLVDDNGLLFSDHESKATLLWTSY